MTGTVSTGLLVALGLMLGAGTFLYVAMDPGPEAGSHDEVAASTVPTLDGSRAVWFTDEAGDAYDSMSGHPLAGTPLDTAGAPHLDIVGFGFVGETPEAIRVGVEVARIDEGFPQLAAPDGTHRMSWFSVCWSATSDGGCSRDASIVIMPHGDAVHTETKFEIRGTMCNEWNWCGWGASSTITYGSPGRIEFDVPRAYLDADGEPTAMQAMRANSGWYGQPDAFPSWHPGVTVHSPAYHFHTHGGAVGVPETSDSTSMEDVGIAFDAATVGPLMPADAALLWGGPGSNHGTGSLYDYPEMDILWFDAFEEGDVLVSRFVVASLAAVPEFDFDYSVGIGLGDDVFEIGWRQVSTGTYGYAGRCVMEECQDGFLMYPEVALTFGSPGVIDVRTPLDVLGSPEMGTATNLFWAMTMYSDVNRYWGDPTSDAIYGDYHSVFMLDSLVGGTPYVFGAGRLPYDGSAGESHEGHATA